MAGNIINSNNVAVLVQNGQAFSTSNLDCKVYKTVQDFNYSIQLPRQDLKQVGSQDLVSREFFFQPDVELSFSYIPEVSASNEANSNFVNALAVTNFKNFFSGSSESDTNFYVIVDPVQGNDVFDKMTFDDSLMNLSGLDCIAFGNCFPTTYGLNYSVGAMPVVSNNFICSNVVSEKLTGTSMTLPSINLASGNTNNIGRSLFKINPDITNPREVLLVDPLGTGGAVTLENLEVGGQNLDGVHFIQSLDMSVDLPRVSNYGLGNNFAYGRKAQLPANGTFNVSSLVSGLDSGIMTGVLDSDKNYNFQVKFQSTSNHKDLIYKVENAKLNSYNYGIPVNDFMTFDAQFSFKVTEKEGLKISGSAY